MRLIVALLLALAAGSEQETGVLRISVVLTDTDGNATPIPRAQLLISDNPTSREPWRVRTGADGTAEIKLPAGNYTVESDLPVTLGGRRFSWTQILDVAAGRDTLLTLTATNADVEEGTGGTSADPRTTHADGAAILNKWRRSLAEIWTPTRHATGFVVDARGLIATNDRALGAATDVEVELDAPAGTKDRVKVPGRVIATDRLLGVSIIWINPEPIVSRQPIAPVCAGAALPVTHQQKVAALIAPILEPKNALLGTASNADSQSFRVDWRLDSGTAGGPVFNADGTAIGITVGDEAEDRERRNDSYVIPLSNVCGVIAVAEKKMAGATAPPASLLRTEAGLPPARASRIIDAKAKTRPQAPVIPADEFDIALVTPAMIDADPNLSGPRTFFGDWTPYVARAPQVLFVRVSPQFEESFWKMLARGAAATQGVVLPPLRSFSANFQRLRAFCGTTEVAPIQRFIIETEIQGRRVREGLYVFALTDFGAHCSPVRVELFSEKSPNKADSRTIEATVFTQIAAASR